jgi:hypothetical protein
VSKKTGEPEPEPKTGKPGNRKSGNRGPGSGSGLEKPKTGYPGSGTRFLVPGFYRVTGNRVKYIFYFFIFFSWGFKFYNIDSLCPNFLILTCNIYIYIFIFFFFFLF